jgi:hypothetical protein
MTSGERTISEPVRSHGDANCGCLRCAYFKLTCEQCPDCQRGGGVSEKKGGWCPECESEGKDPRHNRRTVLCGMHHNRWYRQSPGGRAAYERGKARQYEQRAWWKGGTKSS